MFSFPARQIGIHIPSGKTVIVLQFHLRQSPSHRMKVYRLFVSPHDHCSFSESAEEANALVALLFRGTNVNMVNVILDSVTAFFTESFTMLTLAFRHWHFGTVYQQLRPDTASLIDSRRSHRKQ